MKQQELIAALRAIGVNANGGNLKRLERQGLIPKPRRASRGLNYDLPLDTYAEIYLMNVLPAEYWRRRALNAEDLLSRCDEYEPQETVPDEIDASEETAASVFNLADKLVELRALADSLKEQAKENNAAIESLELRLYEAMTDEGLKNFTRDGKAFSTKRQLWASPIGEYKESVIEILEADEETAGMVTKNVNAQTFAAWVRNDLVGDVDEALADDSAIAELGDDADSLTEQDKEKIILSMKLPKELRDLLNIAIRRQIQIRKAAKK